MKKKETLFNYLLHKNFRGGKVHPPPPKNKKKKTPSGRYVYFLEPHNISFNEALPEDFFFTSPFSI